MPVIRGITDENEEIESAFIEKNIEIKIKKMATNIFISNKKTTKSLKFNIFCDKSLFFMIAAPKTLNIAYSVENNISLYTSVTIFSFI